MTERSYFWDGFVLGDAVMITQQRLMDRFFRSLLNGTGNRGVLKGWLDELEVSGTASPLTVATGGALVYGMFYHNDAPVSVTIPTPASGSRTDLIVLRRSWSAQTVRVARVAGPGAALTQTALVTYEVPLASVTITSDGNVTVADTREFCQFCTTWPAGTVDTEQFTAGAVAPADVPDRTRWQLKGSGSLEPDSANPATWVAGASYDYWEFSDAAGDTVWVYFMVPAGVASYALALYTWSVPDVNGAGGGAENCEWDYIVYYGLDVGVLASTNGTATVDQQARVNTTVYRDTLVDLTAQSIDEGEILIVKLTRDGVGDSYNSAMRLLGVEMAWTADA